MGQLILFCLTLVMGWALKRQARALKVELEPGPSLGPSEKVKPPSLYEPLIFTSYILTIFRPFSKSQARAMIEPGPFLKCWARARLRLRSIIINNIWAWSQAKPDELLANCTKGKSKVLLGAQKRSSYVDRRPSGIGTPRETPKCLNLTLAHTVPIGGVLASKQAGRQQMASEKKS